MIRYPLLTATPLLAILLWSSPSLAINRFNSEENDLALSLVGDEAWLARRAGKWGADDETSRLLYTTRDAKGTWRELETFLPVMAGGDGGGGVRHEGLGPRGYTCLARLSTSRAASWTASEILGWA